MPIQQIGAQNAVLAEVDPAFLARRVVLRSNDPGTGAGAFSVGFGTASGPTATGLNMLTATPPVFYPIAGLQWINSKNVCLVKKITVAFNLLGYYTYYVVGIGLWRATSFVRQFDSWRGNSALPWAVQNADVISVNPSKHRREMLTSDGFSQPWGLGPWTGYSQTATMGGAGPSLVYATMGSAAPGVATLSPLLGGNYILDALPLSQVLTSTTYAYATPQQQGVPQMRSQILHDAEIGGPIILDNMTGLIFTFINPMQGTQFMPSYWVNVQWDEVSSY